MIYKKVEKENRIELEEISFEEAVKLAWSNELHFDSEIESMNFYKEVLKKSPKSKHEERKKDSEIYEMLPYLADEDLHEIVSSIIDEEDGSLYKTIDINELLPYLSEKDVDLLLMKSVSENDLNLPFTELLTFASSKSLSGLVDEYVKGNLQNINMNEMYPYLDSQDIKRVFQYYLSKKKGRGI